MTYPTALHASVRLVYSFLYVPASISYLFYHKTLLSDLKIREKFDVNIVHIYAMIVIFVTQVGLHGLNKKEHNYMYVN